MTPLHRTGSALAQSPAAGSAPATSHPGRDGRRRVAAIDIGTNSTHLVIAEVDPVLRSFSVVLTEKSTTRLGDRDPDTGDLSAEAIERAFHTLRNCRELAQSHGVEQIVTAAATIVFDLVTAVIVGLVIAGLYALRQMARSARVEELPLDSVDHSSEEQALLDQHVVAYRLDGPLFFGAAHRFLMEVAEVSDVRVVILRLSRIQTLDATGASVLGETIKTLEGRGITVLLSGIRTGHEEVFRVVGVFDVLAHERHVFATTPEAIAHAREHLAKGPHHQVPSS